MGNTPDDEAPVFVELDDCSDAASGDICVDPDLTPPELDRSSVSASFEPGAQVDGSGTLVVDFSARDDKAGISTISYRVMDPQGFSHTGYLEHENSDGATYHGDATAWKTYTLQVKLPRGSPPGQWRVESLDIRDKAGNRKHHQFIELLVFSADGY